MVRLFSLFFWATIFFTCQLSRAQETKPTPTQPLEGASSEPQGELSVLEVGALLRTIDPYLPKENVSTEIDVFGSTSMDSLAHYWARGFKKFHPKSKIVISAEGSESVFQRMLKNPKSIGMMSRPVSREDLKRLKSEGLQNPVAVQVGRDAMGVYVHESNPLREITYPQLASLFCVDDEASEVTWKALGIEGDFADKRVEVLGREPNSGTRKFIEDYLFHAQKMRKDDKHLSSNADVLQALSKSPYAIAIADLKGQCQSVRRLNLRQNSKVFDGDEHDVLLGQYPIIRPLTLVFDLGLDDETGIANRELVRYALTQAGQLKVIMAGFFPCDPPTLRGEISKLDAGETPDRSATKPNKTTSK